MKNFLNIKSVNSGMVELLESFCVRYNLDSPIHHKYMIDERMSLKLWLKNIRNINEQFNREEFGIYLGNMITEQQIGIAAYMANSCNNLGEFLDHAPHYVKIWFNYIPLEVLSTDTQKIIHWDNPEYYKKGLFNPETDITNVFFTTVIFKRINQLIYPDNIVFSKIEFTQSKPHNTEIFEKFFRCPLIFNASANRIYLNHEVCEISVKKKDPILLNILQNQANRILNTIPDTESFNDLLSQNIIYAIHNNRTNIEYVAEKIGIPTRLLQYQLKKNGMNYSLKLTQVRKQLALKYLEDPALTIYDISLLLAYKEQASFNRAFKNWMGISPTKWRLNNHL